MKIHGLQKMTLLDYPGRVACTLFTAGCNFRCPFCHNASLVTSVAPEPSYTEAEVLAFLEKRKGLLDGVCLTGGEPLLQPDVTAFIRSVKALGYAVKLDTNGTSPVLLRSLVAENLIDYVAMDIKNSREKYALTAGCPEALLPAVEESVAFLLEGHIPYEFRTTVVAEFHTVADIEAIGRWISGARQYFLQAFVQSDDILGLAPLSAPPTAELERMKQAVAPYVAQVALRGI